MALRVPQSVSRLISGMSDATKVQDSVITAVQPLLDFVNANFVQATDGSLRVLRNLGALGNLIVNGSIIAPVGNLGTLTSQSINAGQVTAGQVMSPLVFASMLSATTGTIGTLSATTATISSATVTTLSGNTATYQNVSSASGFKSFHRVGGYYSTNFAANTFVQTVDLVLNQTTGFGQPTTNQRPYAVRAPHQFSVVGVSVLNGGTTGGQVSVRLVRNGTQILTVGSSPAASGGTPGVATFQKGVYNFNPNDTLTVFVAVGTAGNYNIDVTLELEFGA